MESANVAVDENNPGGGGGRYALPPHLRALMATQGAVQSDLNFDGASSAAASSADTQTKQDPKGSWNQRVMIMGAPKEGVADNKPWFSVDVIVLEHPFLDQATEVVDATRATLDPTGTTLTAEAIYNVKVKASNGGKEKWESYDVPDKMQTLRRGSVYRISVFGKRALTKVGKVERLLQFGDIMHVKGVTCKYKKGKYSDVLGKHRYYTNFSANGFEFRTTFDDADATETHIWLTLISFLPLESEQWFPMIKEANPDFDAIKRQKDAKAKQKPQQPGAAAAAAAAPDVPTTNAADDAAEAGVKFRFKPSRAAARDLGDDILIEESREWKARNFERYMPLNEIAPQLLAWREAMGLPYVAYKTLGGFAGAAEACFSYRRRVNDDEKKQGIREHELEPRWHFGRQCLQVQPAPGRDQFRDSVAICEVTCWKDQMRYIGIANQTQQIALWGFMAEGAIGFIKCFVNAPESAAETEKTGNPYQKMHMKLNNSSNKEKTVRSLYLDLPATVVNAGWEIDVASAGKLLALLAEDPEYKQYVNADMSQIDDRTYVQANPLNKTTRRRIINVLEYDQNILNSKFRFFLVCNRSKKLAMTHLKEVLQPLNPLERAKLMGAQFVVMATPGSEQFEFDQYPLKENMQALLPHRNDLPFVFTIFAIDAKYLEARKFAGYLGTDLWNDVFVPQEDYLLEWIPKWTRKNTPAAAATQNAPAQNAPAQNTAGAETDQDQDDTTAGAAAEADAGMDQDAAGLPDAYAPDDGQFNELPDDVAASSAALAAAVVTKPVSPKRAAAAAAAPPGSPQLGGAAAAAPPAKKKRGAK